MWAVLVVRKPNIPPHGDPAKGLLGKIVVLARPGGILRKAARILRMAWLSLLAAARWLSHRLVSGSTHGSAGSTLGRCVDEDGGGDGVGSGDGAAGRVDGAEGRIVCCGPGRGRAEGGA